MVIINHKIKIIIHLILEHYNWIEDASIKDKIKSVKEIVQRALKPNQHPGGSKEDNIGITFKTLTISLMHLSLTLTSGM